MQIASYYILVIATSNFRRKIRDSDIVVVVVVIIVSMNETRRIHSFTFTYTRKPLSVQCNETHTLRIPCDEVHGR